MPPELTLVVRIHPGRIRLAVGVIQVAMALWPSFTMLCLSHKFLRLVIDRWSVEAV